MKKYLSFLSIFSLIMGAVSAQAAGAQAPIAEGVLACFHRSVSQPARRGVAAQFKTVFVFRSEGQVIDPFAQRDMQGKMMVVTIERSYNSWGVKRSALNYGEGTRDLFVPSSEDWTYPAPEGTVFTARGNYVGFFLSENSDGVLRGLIARPEWNGPAESVECTNSEAELLQWFAVAQQDARSVDSYGIMPGWFR